MPKSTGTSVCCTCGESLSHTRFYKTNSSFYKNGYLPICQDCFKAKFGQYAKEYISNKKAMQRMCIAFDIYFNEDLFDSCDTNNETVIGNYFRKLNLSQHKKKTFENTIEDGEFTLSGARKITNAGNRVAVLDEYGNEQADAEVSPKDVERWGEGLDPVDYVNLNNHYQYLKNANPHCDSNQEIFINDLCYAKMQQLQCVRSQDRDGFKKMGEYYNATFQKSGLKVSNDSENKGDDTLGSWLGRIAQYTPEEYYKNKTLYQDHDGLRDYIERFLLRPLRNLQHGTKDRDREFYVKEDGEVNAIDDTD